MRGLADFIATGDRSEYVVSTLRDLEAFTRQERAALTEEASREPLRLPSIDEVCARVADLDARLAQDPEAGREQLRRWLKDGSIRIGPAKDDPSSPRGNPAADRHQRRWWPKRELRETKLNGFA